MALNIKNDAVEALVAEVAELTGETKTEVIRKAVAERKERLDLRLASRDVTAALTRFLVREAWPAIPPELLGKGISQEEQEAILGYGTEGA